MAFELDGRLAADTIPVGDLMLSRVLLMNDSRFPWAILVPRRPDLTEIIDLPVAERTILMEEIAALSSALRDLHAPTKINVAALGNVVPQLHVHVVARYDKDPAWPGPVFGKGPAVPYESAAAAAAVAGLVARLGVA